ncbi:serine/threonine protein kinase [Roseospira marina]|uniref:Serine/threonine protein kinase n=1 Tax=Roseospira marina TaxID=140057 RepID=A0A5M6ID99_9PROT|nr:serine/threonine-protein kinase [Roseospira marina]KAA5606254.1 serine/threonine protein kinase [Roseospira marina]MBB4314409.1 serine/threonine-protein kinase [Roseospira marina]MBB5087569.1 serine/threonine-protein kinase [Roseospira marina]
MTDDQDIGAGGRTDPACPARIGRYRVDGELGRGAMGVVYQGFDETIDRPVALKTVRADLLDTDDGVDWLERFRQEARAAARCSHANIVTVYEYGEDAGLTFIAMEYVRGRALQSFLAHGVDFGLRVSVRIVMQVLAGLGAAHAAGIVHRDIKPSNIIILDSGTVKVTDFGIARLDSVSLSRHGTMVGTPGYMAPEQFTGGAIDGRTDLFAVGVMLYELVTGTRPFAAKSVPEAMYKVLNEDPPPPVGRGDPLPRGLVSILQTALARRPDERFPDAAAFRDALKGGLAALPSADAGPGETMLEAPELGSDDAEGTRVLSPSMAAAADAQAEAGERGELDGVALKQASAHLASYLGPVASVIVRDAARHASGIRDLYDVLATHIPDEKQRAAFLGKVARRALGLPSQAGGGTQASGTQASGPQAGGTQAGGTRAGARAGTRAGSGSVGGEGSGARRAPALTEADQTRARGLLAEHLGPIAGVLVKKAAAKVDTTDQFAALLAEHIDDPVIRATFLSQMRG